MHTKPPHRGLERSQKGVFVPYRVWRMVQRRSLGRTVQANREGSSTLVLDPGKTDSLYQPPMSGSVGCSTHRGDSLIQKTPKRSVRWLHAIESFMGGGGHKPACLLWESRTICIFFCQVTATTYFEDQTTDTLPHFEGNERRVMTCTMQTILIRIATCPHTDELER